MLPYIFFCHFFFNDKKLLRHFLISQNRLKMANKKMPQKFECKMCNFSCSKKSNFDKHLLTRKHLRLISMVGKNAENAVIFDMNNVCENCGKKYIHQSSLSKHRKKCIVDASNNIQHILLDVLNENKKLQNVVSKQKEQIDNLIPNINTQNNTHINNQINNQFNFQFFLDTECKNAMNLKDFVDSLKIKLDDLNVLKDKGLSESIASVLVNGLKELTLTERPIHCSELSENKLYIKNQNEWKEDIDRSNMENTINMVANKNRKAIKDWEAAHPNYIDDDKLMCEYLIMVQQVMKPINKDDDKDIIIKKVSEIDGDNLIE